MSDNFNHEGDAWDSLIFDEEPEEDGSYLHQSNIDRNYYHTVFHNLEFKQETEKSYLIKFQSGKSLWIPKKIIRNKLGSSCFIHTKTLKVIVESQSKIRLFVKPRGNSQ